MSQKLRNHLGLIPSSEPANNFRNQEPPPRGGFVILTRADFIAYVILAFVAGAALATILVCNYFRCVFEDARRDLPHVAILVTPAYADEGEQYTVPLKPISTVDAAQAALEIVPGLSGRLDPEIPRMIKAEADAREIDWRFALSLATVESTLNPRARNPETNCRGIFQVAPCHWDGLGWQPVDAYDYTLNIPAGLDILGRYLERADGDPRGALKLFGTGEPGTRKVLNRWRTLQDLYPDEVRETLDAEQKQG